jgi:hypothetical protein
MSQENVEVVRRFNAPHEGENLMLLLRALVERAGPEADADVILRVWADDPGWRFADPDIEWDVTPTGGVGAALHGPSELARWWVDWLDVWDSYVYRMLDYRDLGHWVLTPTEIRARGRDGISVEVDVFQMWQVRDGRIAVLRAFLSEQEALEAVGLGE